MVINKVLVIDDEPDLRMIAEMALRRVGKWDVATAASGQEGLELARELSPDVILLDAMMPGMDGPATLAALNADLTTSKIPIIFVTAKAQADEVRHFLELGAAGVIVKPFDPLSLHTEVLAILEQG